MTEQQRALFEAAVITRMQEGGFLEIEIRTECLVRCDDGYQDELINAGWHYWNAAIAAQSASQPNVTGVDIPRLRIGTPVEKIGGYPFPGTVVAAFNTLEGNERFVVEATGESYRGMLHIFNGGQLRAADDLTCDVCLAILRPDDLCATDIELGICHAACLEGTPVVDLDTGAVLPDAEMDTYRFSETDPTLSQGASRAEN